MTPAMASEPYTAEAPSFSTSMRSTALIGSALRSTKVSWVLSAKPKLETR